MKGSKTIQSGNIATITIKVEGRDISEDIQVHSIDINFSTNKITSAQIVVIDGNPTTETFEISSSDTFVPGKAISILAGYNNYNTKVFEGIITGQNINITKTDGSMIEIMCNDVAIKTTVGRKSTSFFQKTDSDIISTIIADYSGLEANVSATADISPQMVQYDTTDWDFIISRAQANGMVVNLKNGVITVTNPILDTTAILSLSYGKDIFELNSGLNAIDQLSNVTASSWDYASQSIISKKSSNSYSGPGDISSKQLSKVIGLETFQLQTAASIPQSDLSNWTKSQMLRSNLSKICGDLTCQGTHLVFPGNFIELKGLGNRFNGDHFVSGVRHIIKDGEWLTKMQFGFQSIGITNTTNDMIPKDSTLVPGVTGLFTGTVKKTHEDPENQYRILVDIPLFDAKGEGIWARHGSFYASNNAGAFFLPEVGDEVNIGFLNQDPRYPIILGSLYSNTKLKPFEGLTPDQDNTQKVIATKSGISISFDDENKVFTIKTPNNNTAIFSDKEKHIIIQDENQNSVFMSDEGIYITSSQDISISSDKQLTLNGTQGVSITSSLGDVEISGMNIKQTADMQSSIDAGASTSINSGGELSLRGSLIMIN